MIKWSIRRPVAVGMFVVAVVIFGVVSFSRLPLNLLPDISYPTLTVETRYAGAAPGEVETLITKPVEEALGVIAGVQRITSRSRSGLSQVTLEFLWKTNMDVAALDVREKLDLVTLPRDADKPRILRFDPATDPIMRLGLAGEGDLGRLRQFAEDEIKKDLESVDGLAAVKVEGGLERQVDVQVDEPRLASDGLTVQDISNALARNNINMAGGSIYEHEARYLVRTLNEFQNLDDIGAPIVSEAGGRRILLRDVARVSWGHKDRDVIARMNGRDSVELNLFKEGDANTVRVARAVKARLATIGKALPKDKSVTTIFDQSTFIEGAINEVISNAWQGGLLAILVIFLFLKDVRSTSIISLSLPVSVVATFVIMYQMGLSLNIMSLGGLALGVGMVVDDSIVVLESIHRHRLAGKSAAAAAADGSAEVGLAVVASTLTTVAVFLPIVFVEGVAGQLFKDQALTVSFSILASLAFSLTLIPMLSAKIGPRRADDHQAGQAGVGPAPGDQAQTRSGAFWHRLRQWLFVGPVAALKILVRSIRLVAWALAQPIHPLLALFDRIEAGVYRLYPRTINAALNRPGLVLASAFLLFVLSVTQISRLGIELIPPLSQGQFNVDVNLPEGTPIETTDRVLAEIGRRIMAVPGVASYFTTAGGAQQSGADQGSRNENVGVITVFMRDRSDKVREEAATEEIRGLLTRSPDVAFKFSRPSYFTFKTPVELELYGNDYDALARLASTTVKDIEHIRGLTDVKSSAEAGTPEVRVLFSPDQLARLKLTPEAVSTVLRTKVRGDVATRLTEGDREIDVVVRATHASRDEVRDVGGLIVDRQQGVPIPLRAVAQTRLDVGPAEIRRIGQRRAVVISGNLQGRDLGSVSNEIMQRDAVKGLPRWVNAKLGGQNLEVQTSFKSLYLAIGLAIFLVYFVMAAQFESLVHPFIIMFSIPLGVVGVIWALLATGHRISVIVLIGAVMLAGIVVKNAIVMIDYINTLRRRGVVKRQAIIEAGTIRLRPILMTTLTTVLGLVPMALGFGEGAEIRAPMAVTVIGGLTISTLLTLIVIPTVYWVVDRKTFAVEPAQ